MDQYKIAGQMIDFQKATFNKTFNAMTMLQDQGERMVNMFLEQSTWVHDQGKKALNEWAQAYKKCRDEYKKAVDESFEKVEAVLAGAAKGKTG